MWSWKSGEESEREEASRVDHCQEHRYHEACKVLSIDKVMGESNLLGRGWRSEWEDIEW